MINGLPDDLPVEDAVACAEMLVALGRAVPVSKWVDAMVAESMEAEWGGLV